MSTIIKQQYSITSLFNYYYYYCYYYYYYYMNHPLLPKEHYTIMSLSISIYKQENPCLSTLSPIIMNVDIPTKYSTNANSILLILLYTLLSECHKYSLLFQPSILYHFASIPPISPFDLKHANSGQHTSIPLFLLIIVIYSLSPTLSLAFLYLKPKPLHYFRLLLYF